MRKQIASIMIVAFIVLLIISPGFAETLELEKELHFTAWREIAEQAASVPQYKYALYASRTLAVKHPELYLQGDALFDNLLVKLPNTALFYSARDRDIYACEELVRSFRDLPNLRKNRFNWQDFSLEKHQKSSYRELYQDAFVFPFLDLRLPPLGVSLLGWDYKATPLAMAQMLYFKLKAQRDVRSAYLLVSDTGEAHVACFDRRGNVSLFDHRGQQGELAENIVLIFNDQQVWYPFMERDDTGRDKHLKQLVDEYASEGAMPRLSEEEQQLAGLLRAATGLDNNKDKRWMSVVASRLHARAWGELKQLQKLYPEWRTIRASHAPDIFTTELAYIHRLANRLSPAASHLAVYALAKYETYTDASFRVRLNYTIDSLSKQYNSYMGVPVVLYPWWYHSELHFLNIDDSVFSKRANCIMISTNLAAILDLAQLPDLTTYQLYIPGHVVLLMTDGEKEYYSVLDNNRFSGGDYAPTQIRGMGTASGWIRLQDHSEPYLLKDVYTNLETDAAEEFIRITLKELGDYYPLIIAKPTEDRKFAGQSYAEFLARIDNGMIKIKKWE